MSASRPNLLVAISGGSGSGKSWLATRLHQLIPDSAQLSLDSFYLDRRHLTNRQRARINYDHPRALDWSLLKEVLQGCRDGHPLSIPHYDFATHTRSSHPETWVPQRVVLVEGLWLLYRPAIRALFDLRVFLACPVHLRLQRRLARDVHERQRTPESVRAQFWTSVVPMHDRFVGPQVRWADIVLRRLVTEADVVALAASLGHRPTLPTPSVRPAVRPGAAWHPGPSPG